jgi:mono/diheme cytochrome c family protein
MMWKLTVRRVLVMAFLAGSPGALANPTTGASDAQPAGLGIELGRADFLTYCAACHGVGGKGDGTVAEFLTITAADLTQLRKMNAGLFPRERITEVIDGRFEVKVHGPRDMPVWGDWFSREAASSGARKGAQEEIVRERINALVGYIETIQEN